jgi:hypothetical protein
MNIVEFFLDIERKRFAVFADKSTRYKFLKAYFYDECILSSLKKDVERAR